MTEVYLSLGSNIGDRRTYLKRALAALADLPETQLNKVSSIYETPAWGLTDQEDFLNACCELETKLGSQNLLSYCQQIEKDLDRVRHEHWGPRTLDIDILLYGNEVIDEDNLKVPHPYMTQRAFVLVPLLEIAPHLILPDGKSLASCLNKLNLEAIHQL